MNKYCMVIDPIRSKNFAVVIEKKTGINVIPLNEMAKDWASSQEKLGNINSLRVPDGMYLSALKNLTSAQEIMLSESIKNEVEIQRPNHVYSGRKIISKSSVDSVTGKQIRKIPISIKLKVINYKASSFKNRAKRSSSVSAAKSQKLKFDVKTCLFTDSSDAKLDLIAKSTSYSMSRRIGASYFVDPVAGNRLSRRSKSLTINNENSESVKSIKTCIDIAISSKAKRFI